MKTKNLMDDALDWAVAKCEGRTLEPSYHAWVRRTFSHAGWSDGRIEQHLAQIGEDHPVMRDSAGNAVPIPAFSRDWSMAGPIIEREGIATFPSRQDSGVVWCADLCKGGFPSFPLRDLDNRPAWWFEEGEVITGPTPLIAGLRAYVASRLGEEIEIPPNLK